MNDQKKTSTKKKKAKKTTVFDDNDIEDDYNINKSDDDKENNNDINDTNEVNIVSKKKKKKKKKKKEDNTIVATNINNNSFNMDEDKEKKYKSKKSKSQIIYNEDTYEDVDNENEDIIEIKVKKKKKKKKTTKTKEKEEEENLEKEEEEEVKPKKKKKKKKVKEDEDKKEEKIEKEEKEIDDEEIPKKKKKKKKKKTEDDENEIIKEDNKDIHQDSTEESIIQKKDKKKDKKKSKDKDLLKSTIYDETKKKLGQIFSTKKNKNKNNDYLETETTTPSESTIEKEKKVVEFLEKAKGIKYTGYNYVIKEEDYFVRNKVKIMTILNSEDAAIKKCEELCSTIAEGKRWIDPDFGSQANKKNKNKESLYGDGQPPSGSPRDTNVEWYPLSQISDCAQFFSDGVESNDVIQGCLGDCWFISALSVIATKDYLLRGEFSDDILSDKKIDQEENMMLSTGVYPPIFHSFRKKGIFCFRFFKNFKWRYVLVDNRLPCNKIYNDNQTPTLLFGQCRARNEFWVPLIEKAYAKLHGSYRSLVSGLIDDGLVDLTGLTSKKMVIEADKLKTRQKADELWDILLNNSTLTFQENTKQKTSEGKIVSAKYYTRNKTMMGCSVESKGNNIEMEVVLHNRHTGILAGHAYSILDVFEIPKPRGKKRKKSRLLRIRNPWGRKEWNGKWSDDSVETKQNKERIEQKLNEKYKGTNEKINLSQEDGTFLMCFSDFRQIFNKLYICKNFPPNFIGIRIYGQWTKNESGGLPVNAKQEKTFYDNPQYYLQRNIDGLVSISLLQNDGRLVEPYFPFSNSINKVCLLIFKITSKNRVTNLNNLLDKTLIVNRRDSILELKLTKGSYVVIPSTFDAGRTGDYCLEFHFEDELIKDTFSGEDKIDCLKNTKIEKLGGNTVKWEILSEFISSKAKLSSTNKEQFIIQKFKEIIKEEDDVDYNSSKKLGTFMRGSVHDEDEDLDYI